MAEQNSTGMSPKSASIQSAAANKHSSTRGEGKTSKKDLPVPSAVPKKKPGKQQPQGNTSSKTGDTETDRLGSIEKLLIQMHRDSREQKAEFTARIDKIEKEYASNSNMQYMYHDSDSMSGEQCENAYPNYGYYGGGEHDVMDMTSDAMSETHAYDDSTGAIAAPEELNEQVLSTISDLVKESEKQNVSKDTPPPAAKPTGFARKFADVAEVGPPLNGELTTEINTMLEMKLKENKIAELLAKHIAPSNLSRLKSPKVNPPIWASMTPKTRAFDIRLQRIQNSLTGGMCALMRFIGDDKLTSELEEVVALLCNANYELSNARKDHIKPQLNPAYGHLCQTQTGSDFLFGDDLQRNVKDITEEKKAVMMCTKQGKPYKAFGKNQGSTPILLKACPNPTFIREGTVSPWTFFREQITPDAGTLPPATAVPSGISATAVAPDIASPETVQQRESTLYSNQTKPVVKPAEVDCPEITARARSSAGGVAHY
ncbi:uncharacterized protein [Amphiura filiformis]|uniref:uncharacterized protein n=1 Tax=Amphiura filiformis TaxID=82378 RepID=UPI003B20DB8B